MIMIPYGLWQGCSPQYRAMQLIIDMQRDFLEAGRPDAWA
jgi:hypothetical protein